MTDQEIEAGTKAVRDLINESGYGNFVSDAHCRELAIAVLVAAMRAKQQGGAKE